jgi:hypothetical protein
MINGPFLIGQFSNGQNLIGLFSNGQISTGFGKPTIKPEAYSLNLAITGIIAISSTAASTTPLPTGVGLGEEAAGVH